MRVARNLAEDVAKSAFRRNGTQPPSHLNGVLGRESDPLDRMERAETFAQLRSLIRQLSEDDRLLLGIYGTISFSPEQHNGFQDNEIIMCQANSLKDGAFKLAPGYA
jgi:hypothetical protein